MPVIEGDERMEAPVNVSSAVVDTERGPMLSISADRIGVTEVSYREVGNETMG